MYILSFLLHWNRGCMCNKDGFCAGDCLTGLKQLYIIVCLDISIALAASYNPQVNNSLALLQSSVLTYMTTCAWYGTAEGKDQQDLYFEYILFKLVRESHGRSSYQITGRRTLHLGGVPNLPCIATYQAYETSTVYVLYIH